MAARHYHATAAEAAMDSVGHHLHDILVDRGSGHAVIGWDHSSRVCIQDSVAAVAHHPIVSALATGAHCLFVVCSRPFRSWVSRSFCPA